MPEKESVPKTILGNKLKLSVKDRFTILGWFPQGSDLQGIRIMKDIREKVELSQPEFKKLKATNNPSGNLTWTDESDKAVGSKKVIFSNSEIGFLKDQITEHSNNKKLTDEMLSLIDRVQAFDKKEDENGNNP